MCRPRLAEAGAPLQVKQQPVCCLPWAGGAGERQPHSREQQRGYKGEEVGEQWLLLLGHRGERMREGRGSWGSEGQGLVIPKPHCTTRRRGWEDF